MYDLSKHPYFEEYVDPKSGVKSYILKERVGFAQQHFYFTNTSLTPDGKYLWIRCINPPALICNLAVVSLDPENPFIRNFPGAGYSGDGNMPGLLPDTNSAVFAEGKKVYKVDIEGNIETLIELPSEFAKARIPNRVLTHVSFSKDKKLIALDTFSGDKSNVAVGNIETGEVKTFFRTAGIYNHAMFSPTENGLMLLDQDGWTDLYSDEHFVFLNRMWLLNVEKETFEAVIPDSWYAHGSKIAHDFWSYDGTLCYIDYDKGAYECDIKTGEHTHVWKRPVCHAHTNYDRSMWVADQTPYQWKDIPCRVIFYDRETNKELDIFSALPYPNIDFRNIDSCYHTDPHPAFSKNGEWIISTTTVRGGNVDVAITPVKPLLEKCRKDGEEVL